jgi:hypothetical protein
VEGAPNELIAEIERRIADDVPGARRLAAEKVNAGIEARVAAIDHVGCDCSIAGSASSFGNATNTGCRVPNGSVEFFNFEKAFAAPFRLDVKPMLFLRPDVGGQGTAIGGRAQEHGLFSGHGLQLFDVIASTVAGKAPCSALGVGKLVAQKRSQRRSGAPRI